MIPPFNKNGYLKKGIHKATLAEIGKRFGSSSSKRRESLFGTDRDDIPKGLVEVIL